MTATHSDTFPPTGNNVMHLSFFKERSGRVQLIIFCKLLCIYYDCDIELYTFFWNKKGKRVSKMLLYKVLKPEFWQHCTISSYIKHLWQLQIHSMVFEAVIRGRGWKPEWVQLTFYSQNKGLKVYALYTTTYILHISPLN